MKLRQLSPLTFLLIPSAFSCSEQTTPSGSTGGLPGTGGDPFPMTGGSGGQSGGTMSGGTSGGSSPSGGTSVGGSSGGLQSTGGSAGSGNATASGGSGNVPNSGGSGGTGGSESSGGAAVGGASGGSESSGGTVNVPDPPRLQNPQDGHATHYWDCCKPSCAWPDQGSAHACTKENQLQSNPDEQSGCFGGNAYQCWSMSPWAVSDTLAYGFAAFNSGSCGSCYQLEFTGTSSSVGSNDPGSAAISHKIMIVQTLNRGGIGQGQFDLLVPGGGVGDFDACSTQWDASGNLGERYGGFFLQCRNQNNGNHDAAKECARNRCNELFTQAGEEDLLAGCLFWVEWANMADNPNFKFGQVDCPSAISEVSGM